MTKRGRPKLYDGKIRVPLTSAQLLHLQMRAVAANESVAAILRSLVTKDMEEVKVNAG